MYVAVGVWKNDDGIEKSTHSSSPQSTPCGGPLGRSGRLHDSVSLNDDRHFGLVSSFLMAYPSTFLPFHFHTQLFPSPLSWKVMVPFEVAVS